MPRCPTCYVPMTRTEEDGIRAHVCGSCFGTWISGVAMLRRARLDAERQKDGVDTTLPALGDLVDVVAESNNKKSQRCPECEKPMNKDRFQQMIPVMIDRCRRCDRLWLDTGEYNLVRRLYVEMMLSEDPQIVRLREKVGRVGAAWEGREKAIDTLRGSIGGGIAGDVAEIALPRLFRILIR